MENNQQKKGLKQDWQKSKRSEEQQIERNIKALLRRLKFLETRRNESGVCNSYDRAEIAALKWATSKLENEPISLDNDIDEK